MNTSASKKKLFPKGYEKLQSFLFACKETMRWCCRKRKTAEEEPLVEEPSPKRLHVEAEQQPVPEEKDEDEDQTSSSDDEDDPDYGFCACPLLSPETPTDMYDDIVESLNGNVWQKRLAADLAEYRPILGVAFLRSEGQLCQVMIKTLPTARWTMTLTNAKPRNDSDFAPGDQERFLTRRGHYDGYLERQGDDQNIDWVGPRVDCRCGRIYLRGVVI